MKRPTKMVASALLLNALLFGLVFAQGSSGTIYGSVEDDEYFVGSVYFQGVRDPDILDASSGDSTFDLDGSGSVTVASQFGGGFPRITIYGGGTITSTREFEEEDVNHDWWDGVFSAPGLGSTNITIDGTDSEHGDNIARFVVEGAYELGLKNETFKFSPEATFIADVGRAVSDGIKLYLAEEDSEGTFVLDSSSYCWVEDGYCVVDVASMSSFALVREVFQTCPSRVEITNGYITGVPNCLVKCDNGYDYEDSEVRRYCAPVEGGGDEFGDEEFGDEEFFDDEFGDEEFFDDFGDEGNYRELSYESDVVYPPGYFKYRETRAGYDRNLDTTGLSGDEKSRVDVINASSLKTVGEGSAPQNTQVSNANNDNDSFLNYILALRGTGKQESSKIMADEAANESSEEGGMVAEGGGEDDLYGSAPLLPSTGSGMLWLLAVIGVAIMTFATVRRN